MGYKSVKNALPSTERTPMTPRYELFIMPACPYCQKVLRFMERRGIEMPLRDITSDPDAREELVRVGGMSQVPCLLTSPPTLTPARSSFAWAACRRFPACLSTAPRCTSQTTSSRTCSGASSEPRGAPPLLSQQLKGLVNHI